jgi:hypothetical protein
LISLWKNAGLAGVFFALFGAVWYGLPLESWGRPRATGIRSKTQENWGFPGSFRSRNRRPGMGYFSAMGRFPGKRKSDR